MRIPTRSPDDWRRRLENLGQELKGAEKVLAETISNNDNVSAYQVAKAMVEAIQADIEWAIENAYPYHNRQWFDKYGNFIVPTTHPTDADESE